MKDLKQFEKENCSKCKYNTKENADMCEIITSRIDGELHCKNINIEEEKNG